MAGIPLVSLGGREEERKEISFFLPSIFTFGDTLVKKFKGIVSLLGKEKIVFGIQQNSGS